MQPEQLRRQPPFSLPQAPFLDAIVQTEKGIVQLIAVERIRETTLVAVTSWIREQPGISRPLNTEKPELRRD